MFKPSVLHDIISITPTSILYTNTAKCQLAAMNIHGIMEYVQQFPLDLQRVYPLSIVRIQILRFTAHIPCQLVIMDAYSRCGKLKPPSKLFPGNQLSY